MICGSRSLPSIFYWPRSQISKQLRPTGLNNIFVNSIYGSDVKGAGNNKMICFEIRAVTRERRRFSFFLRRAAESKPSGVPTPLPVSSAVPLCGPEIEGGVASSSDRRDCERGRGWEARWGTWPTRHWRQRWARPLFTWGQPSPSISTVASLGTPLNPPYGFLFHFLLLSLLLSFSFDPVLWILCLTWSR